MCIGEAVELFTILKSLQYLPCLWFIGTHRIFFAAITDCKEGNKQALKSIRSCIQEGAIDVDVSLSSFIPHVPPVGKSLKAGF